jgi:hypothetical protein
MTSNVLRVIVGPPQRKPAIKKMNDDHLSPKTGPSLFTR